jgi:cytidylate kinase
VGKINIAIDGYSSCGKSTLAKDLARELNYTYVDSGAMYRAVTLFALRNNLQEQPEAINEKLSEINITFKRDGEAHITFLNGENVESAIRQMEVAHHVSAIASIPQVRKKLVELQQRMGENGGVVMDGRDIGTVVFPNAELKIFMTASPQVRAKRRTEELLQKGQNVNLEEVLHNLQQRDEADTTRAADPLRQAADAFVLDNSNLDRQEQLNIALNWALGRVPS